MGAQNTPTGTGYELDGSLLEACSCGILCPCWVGEDPDLGSCYAFNAYHVDRGVIAGIDVSGLNYIRICDIPGNVLVPGSWKEVVFIDEDATEEQARVLRAAFAGEFGGPLADVAGLIGETVAIERAKIDYQLVEGAGTVRIPGVLDSEMEPYRGADERVTTLRDSLFSTVPGSPAWVGKATAHKVTLPQYGMEWEYEGRNAIQAEWKLKHTG
ncbi:MAG TPA: DUF1326 domain-containing protein [Actinomycetota bacterium]|nr:DUF1326 domain-containing protein [Actinomycetota bacterium]